MSTYTLKQLGKYGPAYAMAMLMSRLKSGEPFITYGDIRDELQRQLKIKRIFSTHIGHVAGCLMNSILALEPSAPLINALITRPNGRPGSGVGNYFADRYRVERYRNWGRVSRKEQEQLVEAERQKILRYKGWKRLNERLFGAGPSKRLTKPSGREQDGTPPVGKRYGGLPESDEHKRLKAWVANHPGRFGLSAAWGKGETEHELLSGDTVDVVFSDGIDFLLIEVKSCRSNDDDFRRGIYQCVKYRSVKEAERLPQRAKVKTILITERKLEASLAERARLLGISVNCIKVNK